MIRKFLTVSVLGLMTASAGAVRADGAADATRAEIRKTLGFMPEFVKAIPDPLLPGVWAQVRDFDNNPKTALSAKEKDLIALAVAAQSGNRATIYAYTRCARANGATPAEIGEAVGMAALSRQGSTFMNGIQLDETAFRAEIKKLADGAKAAAANPQAAAPPRPIAVVDGRTALEDIKQSFGFVPEFMKKMPPEVAAGAWLQIRDLEMGKTALPNKTKSLIGLAVSAQIPCRYCVFADTEFAKLDGATDREIAEAVSAAGIARSFGALIDGLQVDEAAFRRDYDRLTGGDKVARRGR
jgi:AhpD family alkylhydroperoxidase